MRLTEYGWRVETESARQIGTIHKHGVRIADFFIEKDNIEMIPILNYQAPLYNFTLLAQKSFDEQVIASCKEHRLDIELKPTDNRLTQVLKKHNRKTRNKVRQLYEEIAVSNAFPSINI